MRQRAVRPVQGFSTPALLGAAATRAPGAMDLWPPPRPMQRLVARPPYWRPSTGAITRSTVVACAGVLTAAAALVALGGVLFGRGGAASDRAQARTAADATAVASRPSSGPRDAPATRTVGPGCPPTPAPDRSAGGAQETARTRPAVSPVDRARELFRILDPKGYARAEQPGALPATGHTSAPTPTSRPGDVPVLLEQIRALPGDDPAAAACARRLLADSTVAAVRLAALRRLEGIPGGLPVDLLERVVAAGPLAGADGMPAVAAWQVLLQRAEPAAAQAVERLRAGEFDPARRKILSQLASAAR